MTKRKRQTGHYVIARPIHDPGRWKLLVGPFETHHAAYRMTGPVRAATHMQRWTIGVIAHTIPSTATLPAGSLDLRDLDPADVIKASAKP